MSFLAGAFSSLIGGGIFGDVPSSFGYSIGREIPLPYPSIFSLYEGHSKDTIVCVWVFNKKQEHCLEFAKKHLKALLGYRHPVILKPLANAETATAIYVATEYVVPLTSENFPEDSTWMMYQIAQALEFLHTTAKITHSMICPAAFMITKDDQVRLTCYDVSVPCNAGGDILSRATRHHPVYMGNIWQPPDEYLTPQKADMWGFAASLAWAYLNSKSDRINYCLSSQLFNSKLPPDLKRLVNLLLKTVSSNVFETGKIINDPYFKNNPVVVVLSFLDNFSIYSDEEKNRYFQIMNDKLVYLPITMLALQVFPRILHLLNYGGGDPMQMLPTVLAVSRVLSAHSEKFTENERKKYCDKIAPLMVKLLQCQDRTIRYNLLQNLNLYEHYLNSRDVECVFDKIMLGAKDSAQLLREATIKSLVLLIPKCQRRALHERAVTVLTATLKHEVDSNIRANAVIVFGRLAPYWHPDIRSKVLVEAMRTALYDRFIPCRTAALKCLQVCIQEKVFTAEDVANKILPIVIPRCADKEQEIRVLAFSCAEAMLSIIKSILIINETKKEEEQVVISAVPAWKQITGVFNFVGSGATGSATPVVDLGKEDRKELGDEICEEVAQKEEVAEANPHMPPPPPIAKPAEWQDDAFLDFDEDNFSSGPTEEAPAEKTEGTPPKIIETLHAKTEFIKPNPVIPEKSNNLLNSTKPSTMNLGGTRSQQTKPSPKPIETIFDSSDDFFSVEEPKPSSSIADILRRKKMGG